VVHTKPRQEKVAIENLKRQGYTAYCPQTVQAKRRRQCWQKVIEPLFPRYLFVQLNIGVDNFTPIRSTLGVIGLVRFGNQPAAMPEPAIHAIQLQETKLIESEREHPNWQNGDCIEVIYGPFAGLKGIFQKKLSNERVSLLLDMLGQQSHFSIQIHHLASAIY